MACAKGLAVLLVALLVVEPSVSSKILGFLITPSRSHFIVHDALMRGLAAKGHQVTVVSLFPPPKEVIPNYTPIQLEMNPESGAVWKQLTTGFLTNAENQESIFRRMPTVLKAIRDINSDALNHTLVQKLRREETFDLVAFGWFFNDFQIGLAAHFNCPAVMIASMNAFKNLRDFVGNPSGPAHTPMSMTTFPAKMSYWQRVGNFAVCMFESVFAQIANRFVLEPEYQNHFPANKYPSFSEAKKNIALVLVTSHFSQDPPILSFPAMIEVSGMHIKRKPDPLPKEIQEWLDTAPNGVVYFSLGSNIKSTQISKDRLDAIMSVFGRIKQRVLWKFEEDNLPGKPENVMIQKWLPQDDVLAHPNVILFISHCGKGGMNEARYHGVPILGIPIFADQPANMAEIASEGWGVALQYSDLTEATFEAALNEALTNPRYGEVVKTQAQLFRDRPQHPLDTAIFWVEYVIRHKGAKHMQSPAVHLTWYEFYSIDVIGFYLAVIWVVFKLTKLIVKKSWRFVFRRKPKQD